MVTTLTIWIWAAWSVLCAIIYAVVAWYVFGPVILEYFRWHYRKLQQEYFRVRMFEDIAIDQAFIKKIEQANYAIFRRYTDRAIKNKKVTAILDDNTLIDVWYKITESEVHVKFPIQYKGRAVFVNLKSC